MALLSSTCSGLGALWAPCYSIQLALLFNSAGTAHPTQLLVPWLTHQEEDSPRGKSNSVACSLRKTHQEEKWQNAENGYVHALFWNICSFSSSCWYFLNIWPNLSQDYCVQILNKSNVQFCVSGQFPNTKNAENGDVYSFLKYLHFFLLHVGIF